LARNWGRGIASEEAITREKERVIGGRFHSLS